MHGPVPQASPPQPQVSHSITAAGTPSVARSAAYFLQLHLEYGVESTHSCWICALPGSQGVHRSSKQCVPAARAGCGAATNSRHAFWDISSLLSHVYTRTTCQPVLRTCRREEFSLFRLSFSFLQGERHWPLYFQGNIYAGLGNRTHTTQKYNILPQSTTSDFARRA